MHALRLHLSEIVSAAVAGAHAGVLVRRALDPLPSWIAEVRSVDLLAVGKAAAAMASALAAAAGSRASGGLVIGPRLDPACPDSLTQLVSSHPVPDGRSVAAGRAALALAADVEEGGSLVVLLSGGASALMAVPADGVSLETKQAVTRQLLRADADIQALNCVRKHLSAVKGGQLAARCAGRVLTLAVSDVVGDDPSVIGSGPTVGDPSTFGDALSILDRCGGRTAFPDDAVGRLEHGAAGEYEETPKPGDAALARASYRIIGSSADALDAAARHAAALGYRVIRLEQPVVGEARRQAVRYAETVHALTRTQPDRLCVLSSGETTVRVSGAGRGGRNQEFALAAVHALAGIGRPAALASVGSDGVDGPTDAAGAVVDSATLGRAVARGLDPLRYLEANDAWTFFEALGDLVRTGRTDTNVGDLQVTLVAAASEGRRSA